MHVDDIIKPIRAKVAKLNKDLARLDSSRRQRKTDITRLQRMLKIAEAVTSHSGESKHSPRQKLDAVASYNLVSL